MKKQTLANIYITLMVVVMAFCGVKFWTDVAVPKLAEFGVLQIKYALDYDHRKETYDGQDHYRVVLKNNTTKSVKVTGYTNLWNKWYNILGSLSYDRQERKIEVVIPPGEEVTIADYTSAEGEWFGRTTQFYWGTEEFVSK